MDYFVHESSYIDENVTIGQGTKIWHFCHVLKNSTIGERCVLGQNVMVGPNVYIGNNVKIHSRVYVSQFTLIEDDAFMGPGVTLTNDIHPGCPNALECMEGPRIRKGAQIGANTCVLPRVVIGEHAVIGAGSVVTKDIPPGVVACGNPAQVICEVGDLVCTTGLRDKPYNHIIESIEDAYTIS